MLESKGCSQRVVIMTDGTVGEVVQSVRPAQLSGLPAAGTGDYRTYTDYRRKKFTLGMDRLIGAGHEDKI